jgi:sulfatase modifying factor 1
MRGPMVLVCRRHTFPMRPKLSYAASMFDKVLRAFETGGFTYTDVLAELELLLTTGAPPIELLEVLQRRELIEPLPEYAHVQVLDLLNDAIERAGEKAVAPAEAENADAETVPRQVADAEAGPFAEAQPVARAVPERVADAVSAPPARPTPVALPTEDTPDSVPAATRIQITAPPPPPPAADPITIPGLSRPQIEASTSCSSPERALPLDPAPAQLKATPVTIAIERAKAKARAFSEAQKGNSDTTQDQTPNSVPAPSSASPGGRIAPQPVAVEVETPADKDAAAVDADELDGRSNRVPTGTQFVEFSAPRFAQLESGRARKPGAIARAARVSAAVFMVAVVAWFFAHRKPVPTQLPAVLPAAVPAPVAVIRDCPTCPSMTVLPAGRFKQGSARAQSASYEKPLHWVAIGRPLAMSTNAVTVDEFHQFIAATRRDMQGCDTYDGEWKHQPMNSWESPGFTQTGKHPVTCASWNDAQAYAQWLSASTGHRYRLPSASEWEYAARAGGEAVQPWNPDGSDACANANVADASAAHRYPGWTVLACDDGYVYTAPVGSFKANSFGLNDMLGNVFQWTLDCWHKDYTGAPVDGSARVDGNCAERELRGGSWFSTPAYVRADYRNHFAADYRTSSVGIRLIRDLEQ